MHQTADRACFAACGDRLAAAGARRRGLLATTSLTPVVLAALISLAPGDALSACVDAGATRNCTGDVTTGTLVIGPWPSPAPDIRSIVVDNLTSSIVSSNGPAIGLLRFGTVGVGPNLLVQAAIAPGLVAQGAPLSVPLLPRDLGTVHALSVGGRFSAGGAARVVTQGDFDWLSPGGAAISAASLGGFSDTENIAGGMGGVATVTAVGGIVRTTADNAVGLSALSRGGRGADGDSGSGLPSEGGVAGAGGSAAITSSAVVVTSGRGAVGLLAQSRGGQGGDGADAVVFGRGADGGAGGAGGVATVLNIAGGSVATSGLGAHGAMAISVGGGGGAGGDFDGIVGLGGAGAQAGAGGIAFAVNEGVIATQGMLAAGLVSMSVGGGGGDGGTSQGIISLGGAGTLASAGGNVLARNSGSISTTGGFAQGIFALSQGGGGGRGATASGVISVGGEGGGGGSGGTVTVHHAGSIATEGLNAEGILALSVGGGGGAGGNATAIAPLGPLSVAIGGSGGAGGTGGTVRINPDPAALPSDASPTIATRGDGATGIAGLSVGGGGGSAGSAVSVTVSALPFVPSVSVALGGSGGAGGAGGLVESRYSGSVETRGDVAHGIRLQSVGGGGGAGGSAISVAAGVSAGISVGLGGSGGGGGAGGVVTYQGAADISTLGASSVGIMLQSIGGGGGDGGSAISVGANASGSIAVALGGTGGLGGAGNNVEASSTGSIQTLGDLSHGIMAQSVGGGGGNGGQAIGFGAGLAGSVTVALGGAGGVAASGRSVTVSQAAVAGEGPAILTHGVGAYGILAQSVGGGGGHGGVAGAGALAGGGAVNVALGGQGGLGSNGGTVEVGGAGAITTLADNAAGIFAQSVGGGGGVGALGAGAAATLFTTVGATIGGTGGAGGNGGRASVTYAGDVSTGQKLEGDIVTGRSAGAIVAQSIGGGGGAGGLAGGASAGMGTVNLALGGSGASGGSAGIADIAYSGHARTVGDLATGLLAQSIGGGGGIGGVARGGGSGGLLGLSITLGGSGAAGGNGARSSVALADTGSVVTEGDQAHGVVAQSIGGGGGLAGTALGVGVGAVPVTIAVGGAGGQGGSGGAAVATSAGSVATLGSQAHGLVAQSIGGGGGIAGESQVYAIGVPIGVPVGGQAGGGGAGGLARAENTGSVSTAGDLAAGILAQSVGGGGGVGAYGRYFGFQPPQLSDVTLELSVTLGGRGGVAGGGGQASVAGTGAVATTGAMAPGILAQSIGGGGGIGATANGQTAGAGTVGLTIAVGGGGGSAGGGGVVALDYAGSVSTEGPLSYAIHAQSVGGGGGAAGSATAGNASAYNLAFAVGGTGGSAGSGGLVSVRSTNIVATQGELSTAILAQSIGGGGGAAGGAMIDNSGFGTASMALGGNGGFGGAGGGVLVTRSLAGEVPAASGAPRALSGYGLPDGVATLGTAGGGAPGIVAQSIGGGGGLGATNLNLALVTSFDVNGLLPTSWDFRVGTDGIGGAGGVVTVAAADNILTGGVAPAADPAAPLLTMLRLAGLSAEGGAAPAIVAQSIGGGGGTYFGAGNALLRSTSGRAEVGVELGGTAAASNAANAVAIRFAGAIQTAGLGSDAVVAQSVGGGGGAFVQAAGGLRSFGVGLDASVLLGGQDIRDGTAGSSAVTFQGRASTTGQAARGIVAQSIGGGGGLATLPIATGIGGPATSDDDVRVALGGVARSEGGGWSLSASSDSPGGAVSVRMIEAPGEATSVSTIGRGAHAIVAQSVGNGGGLAEVPVLMTVGDNVSRDEYRFGLTLGGGGGTAFATGSATVDNQADIATAGGHAIGIAAQSIGAGGGLAGMPVAFFLRSDDIRDRTIHLNQALGARETTGSGGAVTLSSNGIVQTAGFNAHGLLAQSIGGGGGAVVGALEFPIGTAEGGDGGAGSLAPRHRVEAGIRLGGIASSGDGGIVRLTNVASVVTRGDAAFALLGQSIGGGGGIAGLGQPGESWLYAAPDSDIGLTVSADPADRAAISFRQLVDLGAGVGSGGAGGAVDVVNKAAVATFGSESIALLAQSIGGGGGAAGLGMADPSGRVTLGGALGLGGDGGRVTVTLSPPGGIVTQGRMAHGVVAQSIGGGGGMAGGGLGTVTLGTTGGIGGNGNRVAMTLDGAIAVDGSLAAGAVAQSIGAGGGIVAADRLGGAEPGGRSVRLGASLGASGSGGQVTVTQGAGATLQTGGLFGLGLLAQSVGGGGGLTLLHNPNATAAEAALRPVHRLGALSGAAGDGGAVTVTQFGVIATDGEAAHGLVAQSIGGGGGLAMGSGLHQLGAGGAQGGAGGNVVLSLRGGGIFTTGDFAHGAVAQSVGGGGGLAHAQLAAGQEEGVVAALPAVVLGGTTAAAAPGGTASMTLATRAGVAAAIRTQGDGALGALVQSVGGGGGVSGGILAAQGQLTLGTAGAAGSGGAVALSLNGSIATEGKAAPAALVQSIGAGGGFASASTGAVTLGANQPGDAGAGSVRLTLAGTVSATGQDAPAVVAQSVAAGGGFVGVAGGALRLGSQGGSSDAPGAVDIRNNAAIGAAGDYATALLAQSIGGGGGVVHRAGGSATLGLSPVNVFGINDFGASAAGGAVTTCATPTVGAGGTPCSIVAGGATGSVTPGPLTVGGTGGIALVAQSIAGGGGFVGEVAGSASLGSVAAGNGGIVAVAGPGAIAVLGANGAAAVAQSVGGGGGIVARAGGAAVLGGSAGGVATASSDADGSRVTLQTDAAVTATAAGSLGLVAQSIGGGGGTLLSGGGAATLGGSRPGDGGSVELRAADAATSGAALIAQSIGGGGGLVGRANGVATLGGSATGAGQAARVAVRGWLSTAGDAAPAIVAQSLGGGGGIVLGGAGSATLGGSGVGRGGAVNVEATEDTVIATAGIGSAGIVAQSLGGGGGVLAGLDIGRVVFGGTATTASDGGTVDVDSKAAITTSGVGAHGIVAQSGGGGGGIVLGTRQAGASSPVRSGAGSGGSVNVVNGGPILVSGANAHGIVAHSAGGGAVLANEGLRLSGDPGSGRIGRGGGVGTAGPISIFNNALVAATGANGIGILAHSYASVASTAATVTIELDRDSEVVGGPGGAAIHAQSATTPITLVNRGLIRSAEGIAGRAVSTGSGSGVLNLTNHGVITGNFSVRSATIDNRPGGFINAGPSLALGGAAGTLTNNGGFAVAGRGVIGTTELNGRFVQGATGAIFVDVAGRPGGGIDVDRLTVTRTATLGGSVRPELIPGTSIAPGTHQATFLSASQGVTATSPVLVPPSTLNMTWSLQYPNANEAAIRVDVTTLAPAAAMTANQRSVAAGLQRAAVANPAGFAPLAPGVYGATDAVAYASAMTSLGGDGGMTGLIATQGAMRQFMSGLTARMDLLQRSFQADVIPPASFLPYDVSAAFAGNGAIRGDGALLGMDSLADTLPSPFRVWAMPIGFGSGTDARAGFGTEAESRVGGFMTGFDTEIAPRLTIGAVGGWSDGGYSAGSVVASGTLRGAHAGTYALWQDGPMYVSGIFGYARHDARQSRLIAAPGVTEIARDDLAFHNVGANLEMGYRFDVGEHFALTPLAGIGLNAWHREGSSEASRTLAGAGGMLGLSQGAAGDYSVPISLGFRADTAWDIGKGLMLSGHARMAWVREDGASASSTAALAFAPGETFRLQGPAMPRDRMSFNVGLQLQPNERVGFGVSMLGDVGDGYSAIGGVGRVVWRW